MERSIEEDVRELLLATDDRLQYSAYRKSYENLRIFFQENKNVSLGREFLYEPSDR